MVDVFFDEFSSCGPELHHMLVVSKVKICVELIRGTSGPSFFKSAFEHTRQVMLERELTQPAKPALKFKGPVSVNELRRGR